MALGAKQVPPTMLSHRRGYFFFLLTFDTMRAFSIFFRR
jgi:hypothetical protein